jgi:hypothetical protein
VAAIGNDPNGRKRILFVAAEGSRKTIRLGKATTKQAEAFKLKVEALVGAGITGSMDDETSRWLAALETRMHDRLAAAGLVKPRQPLGATTLGPFIDGYIRGARTSSQTPSSVWVRLGVTWWHSSARHGGWRISRLATPKSTGGT